VCALLDEIAPAEDGRPYGKLITFVTDRPGHDKRYAIDASRITAELGWTPTADTGGALRDTVRWYVERRDWWERILRGEYRLERIGLGTAGAGSEENS